jgi:tRNA(Ile2) C34 agmatinyltransferase TiaS
MLIYGGVKYSRIRHAIYCRRCKETLESRGVHDFKMCSCGSIGIDDNRVLGQKTNMESRSMYVAFVNGKTLWLPQSVIEAHWSKPYTINTFNANLNDRLSS